jgi:uncharacterized protein with ParB-like and HNH nuclease domain
MAAAQFFNIIHIYLSMIQMSFQTPITIVEVVEKIHNKSYLIPSIQRELVWEPDQVVKLFDSLMRDYPIGSFLFWQVDPEKAKEFQFYEFIREYHQRYSKHNVKANISGDYGFTAVLDGQQRLTALYIGLKGKVAYHIPNMRWDSDQAYPWKELYLNLLSPSKDEDLIYNFRFLTKEEAAVNNNSTYWFKVGKILDLKEPYEVNDYLIKAGLNNNEGFIFANKTLFKLQNIVHSGQIINYYLEKAKELDKVLNIFVRINSGGTPLSYSDLLLSIASAQWTTFDAREEINNFVDELNRLGNGFSFDKDFVLKSCLVLSEVSDIAFKVDNFNKTNMTKIEQSWDKTSKAIRQAVELVSSMGYDGTTLTSKVAIIPIANYLLRIGTPNGYILASAYENDRRAIKKWLATALLKRTFSGTPDNVLRPLRNIINENSNGFPLTRIIEDFRGKPTSFEFSEDEILNLLNYEYGDKYTFSVLSMLYPTLDTRNRFHLDHIYPKSGFKRSNLKKLGIEDRKIGLFSDNFNKIGNLQLLEGLPNIEKGSTEFQVWIEQKYPLDQQQNDYKERHMIPDVDFDMVNFDIFMSKREEIMLKRLKELLS